MNLTLPKDNQQLSKEEASNFIVFVAIYCDTIWMTKNRLIRQNDNELLYLWVLFMDSLTVFINFFFFIYYFFLYLLFLPR